MRHLDHLCRSFCRPPPMGPPRASSVAMGKYTHMHEVEAHLARRWHQEQGVGLKRTAELLQRCPRTVRKTLGKSKTAGARVGRPPMSEQDNAKCDAALVALQKRAKAQREVTASMVKQNAGVPYCEATIRNAFRLHGKPFRRLWEKPVLKPEDVTKRLAFVTKCGARPRPAGRPGGRPGSRPSGRPSSRPSSWPSSRPSGQPERLGWQA